MALWMAAGTLLAQGYSVGAPAVAARSAVLMNAATGEILFAKEPHLQLPPASTTKVLTALVTLERMDVNARLPVSAQAASAPPSRIGLRAGEAALTQDLLYGLMLKSGNDAAETLAEGVGGSVPGFAQLMNARARQIGARNSNFMNPHGLPNDNHYSTAYDLALIFRHAMSNPYFAETVRTRSADLRIESSSGMYGAGRMIPVVSHNRLLTSYEGAQGGKTGFTFKARRCYVGEVDRGGVRLIVSILNSPNSGTLWQDARKLLDYGFARYGLAPPPPAAREPEPILVQRAQPRAIAARNFDEGRNAPRVVNVVVKPPITRATRKPVAARPAATKPMSVMTAKAQPARATQRTPLAANANKVLPMPAKTAKVPPAKTIPVRVARVESSNGRQVAVVSRADTKSPAAHKVARTESPTKAKR